MSAFKAQGNMIKTGEQYTVVQLKQKLEFCFH